MGLHILCPTCGTEFSINHDNNSIHTLPDEGTYFLLPKSKNISQETMMQFINNMNNARVSNGNLIIPSINQSLDPFDEFDAQHPEMDIPIISKTNNDHEKNNGTLDEIEQSILNDGYIPNNQLWRRWIMAQMLRHYKDANGNSTFDAYFVSGKPYIYQWDTILNEIKVLKHLKGHELENRERFFNKDVVRLSAMDYERKIRLYISNKAKRYVDKGYNRKHVNKQIRFNHTYVPIHHSKYNKVYISDKTKITDVKSITLTDFLKEIHNDVEQMKLCNNYHIMYNLVTNFIKKYPMDIRLMKSEAWKNAFKGAGAYYTMDNMIKFHSCNFVVSGQPVTTQQSLHILETKTSEYKGEYYRLYALMQKFVEDNHFDFERDVIDKLTNKTD